ncbi:MAG: diguanylate cyclase [Azoarcus sp.]|jgi:diguanylate cyclase (GGDEF)-like protein|nr:diguanylate cyclase [Azoarcus sp.]
MGGSDKVQAARKTLFSVLRHVIFWPVALTLVVSAVVFVTVSFHALRLKHESNMTLIARTIAYSTEAALVFGDKETAGEILNDIIIREHLCNITIRAADGSRFAQTDNSCDGAISRVADAVARIAFFDDTTSVDIIRNQQRLGSVEIKGDGSEFTSFLSQKLIIFVACLVLALLAARIPARWMEQRFAAELAALSNMARAARLEGNFTRRLPPFEIAEFNSLGQDFNALFGEIQTRNAELKLRQSQLEIVNNTLSRMAMRDTLTGLANRSCFSEQLEKTIEKARTANAKVGVLYIDNDHFKEVNDNHGHAAGDALLVNIGHRLSGAVRESDLVARLGGDEFAILLAPVSSEDDLQHVANKVLAATARKLRLVEKVDIELGVSIGMALFPDQANDPATLLRAADHAMYRAKRLGRGRACLYDPSVDVSLEET